VLSFTALIAAIAGAVLGLLRIERTRRGLATPYRGWHAWHHVLGLTCAPFVLTWIFSGWLSMDSGLLFSTGRLTGAEAVALASAPAWESLPDGEPQGVSAQAREQAREIEWFSFNAKLYRRVRTGLDAQDLSSGELASGLPPPRAYLTTAEVEGLARHLPYECGVAAIDKTTDAYPVAASMPGAPVYRIACGAIWFHVDGASGAILERLDPSRRAYRWLYGALHTLEIPALATRPVLRGTLVVGLCACGLVFSLTGCVIGWRRLRASLGATTSPPAW
jgi:uncharacterized iron-regulated membrane protein